MWNSQRARPRIRGLQWRTTLLVPVAVVCFSLGPAAAQTLNSGTGILASKKVSELPSAEYGAPPLPAPEALIPQVNQMLAKYGAAVLLDNTDEFQGSIAGGNHEGSANTGQYGLEWDQDWDTLANLHGFQTHAVAVGRYGIPVSRIFGDNLNPSQEIYGSGGNVAIHLVFFYGEETLARGRVALAAGRFPSQNDFDSSPLNCNFENNTICGSPVALFDGASNSAYPDANWGTRLRVRPVTQVYAQAGVFFTEDNIYNATNGYRSGFRFAGNHINGEFFPVEVGFEPTVGLNKRPGHYKIGFGYDNNNHPDNYYDASGNAFAQTGLAPRMRKGGTIVWVDADQMLVRQGPGATDGIILKAGYVHNDPRYSTRADQFYAFALDSAFWKERPLDTIGVLFSYTSIAGSLGKTEALQQELREPIVGTGVQFYNATPGGLQTHSINIELNYDIHLFRGVNFAPDFQYFIRPNAEKRLPDAALFGFKSHIELFPDYA